MMRIFNTWRIRRTEKRLRALPDRYRQTADDEVRTAIIDEANVRLAMLELDGVVTKAERLAMGREWVREAARHRVGEFFRDGNAAEVKRWGRFLAG
jgi:hypothetical protein